MLFITVVDKLAFGKTKVTASGFFVFFWFFLYVLKLDSTVSIVDIKKKKKEKHILE